MRAAERQAAKARMHPLDPFLRGKLLLDSRRDENENIIRIRKRKKRAAT